MHLFYKLKFTPSQIVSVSVLLTLLLFIPQVLLNWQAFYNFNSMTKQEFNLQRLSDEITYFDEVLTMSARMNAATGNNIWEKRYRQFEPKLDFAIKEAIKLAPEAYKDQNAQKIDIANQKLVAMEYQSFDLVNKNQKQDAQQLLSSRKYEIQKQIYADGIAKRNQNISLGLQLKVAQYRQRMIWAIFGSIISLIVLVPVWFLVLRLLQEYVKAKKITQATLEETNYILEKQVAARTENLKQKNIQLQQTLQELQETQVQLIQTEKMSSLGQLVAGVAHEINNPVNFIYGNLIHVREYTQKLLTLINRYQQEYSNYNPEINNLIEEIELDFLIDDLPKIISSMEVGTERIREIVLSLRNFSRLDEAEMKPVNIHEGIDSTLLILQDLFKGQQKQQEIVIIKNYGNLPLIECYAGGLNQVFMNILINAIDALRQQEIDAYKDIKQHSSSIIIHTQVKNEDNVMISIKDNGTGIREKVKSKLFEPFFTTKPVGKGTGLGLSISYQIIVDKHKGKIEYVSEPGKGTEFLIEIPIRQIKLVNT
ncbi:GHKL domain-containing protein [Anabaena cylindrica FACHB-243]|uniref:histidine kinase n=1 Tax=Anabaena cylindrica (strain ATCC 27899 / PCC 7122) TaxID=272123 RepID=K9ZMJ5_ANACC|nr:MULTISPECIES: ATP-binding protein [Anabaena]AFZ59747.1 integral membrane sensor signal transduction histidine kinase [Anabaena cylindrica PCC 7122]MBD2417152.1 GHKL domain-containing protein [Anabaena cylindrica FACHB-243]MBY5283620.1 GHKL domain-containing protein [Anabaena sp. CCAP 1446/1C]MBY5307877.1 GHKL domain-containing protein [Anabaena sp. CCAP 1446/1C]MCM2405032.1 ATP-binding protein [Anabaena sp. CCAP 1446/1C]